MKESELIKVRRVGVAIIDREDGEILQLHVVRDLKVAGMVSQVEGGVVCLVEILFKKGTVKENIH